jgi:transcriptional regulator with XRE-family HTH domain
MTQQNVADKMKTSQSQIVRLESGKGTIASLRRYAKATGKRMKITLV